MVAPQGHRLAILSFEGAGRPVLAVHATGFCKELWAPAVAALRSPCRVVAFDQRGHGDSGAPPPPWDWWDLGREALVVLEHIGEPAVGLGHSSGGAALAMAEILQPGSFRALVLIEPIILPPPFFRAEENPLSTAALRRRATFPSPAAARAALHGRGAFGSWTEEALGLYVRHGLQEEGSEWVLKCSPAEEAECYRGATAHGAWDRLGEIGCPVVLVAGARSDSHGPSFSAALGNRFQDVRLEVVPDAGHFLPMERPAAVAALLDALL